MANEKLVWGTMEELLNAVTAGYPTKLEEDISRLEEGKRSSR